MFPPGDYVELHCHSFFSLLDGASSPEELVARARELGMTSLALTDHDDLGGAVRFAQAAREAGVGAIIGAEIVLELDVRRSPFLTHLGLLAESAEGYANLSTLITRARMDRPRGAPAVALETLAQYAGGLHALTGCPRGWVPSLAAAGDLRGAREAAGTLANIFGRRVAIECWDHGLAEERRTSAALVRVARATGLPWVVTNDVHYARAGGRVVHDVLTSLRHARPLDAMGTRLRPSGEWHLKGAAQMARRWRHDPAGLRATLEIAERCAFRLEHLTPSLPRFPLPPGVTADEYLARLVEEGADERWGRKRATGDGGRGMNGRSGCDRIPGAVHPPSPVPRPAARTPAHDAQLAHELSIISRLGLAGYFLIVWDIVRFARREGILCQGRGSAANSAVCYCLGITAVDPVRMGLLFERFLSEERREAPDIDLDFAHRERERVIQYVYERYGREHAAMVCEHITYRGRSAVRDAARVLGFSVEQAAALSALSDRFSARATAEALKAGAAEDEGRRTARTVVGTAVGPEEAEADVVRSHVRRDADKAMLAAGATGRQVVDALASGLVRGTEATTRANAVKAEARAEAKGDRAGDRTAPTRTRRPLTAADRPQPNAAYEPYGSPNGHDAARSAAREPWTDAHARADDHVERRNPTTAFRETDPGAADTILARAGLDAGDRRVRALAEVVGGLHQVPRHRGIHVGGFVLSEAPISTVVPVEPAAMPGRTVIQWEKDDLDPVGLVKIDLLGLGMLTLLQDCLLYIRQTRGVTVDLARLDMDDQAVYDDLCRADTIGVFQVESRAQMSTLPRLKPRSFYDLVVQVAIIRPGPIQGDMVHPYLRRRAGEEPVAYPHPALEPILKRTLGVPLFQEQGMQVAIACAGFSPGEADNLRRAMGHKRSRERMAEICERLIEGMRRNGIAEETARNIYNQINAFADYGFPESHAASFALLVYASAYLRHYYAPEFAAAILNAQPMGFYSVGTLIEDARRHGVEVRPVDLTRSGWNTTLEESGVRGVKGMKGAASPHSRAQRTPLTPAVRLGLRLVTGLGPAAREKLEGALRDGPFTSVGDVVRRAGLDRRALRVLAEAGAFDAMVPEEPGPRRRRSALWRVLEALRGDAGPLAPRAAPASGGADGAPRPPALPPMSPFQITEADYRITGLSLNGHPLRHLRPLLEPNGVRTARDLLRHGRDGERNVAVAGLVIVRQRPGTAKGFVFLSLEDETGIVNVVVTPQRFERQALLLATSPLLLVRGTLQVQHGVVNLRGEVFRELKAEVGAEHVRSHDFH